MDKSNDSWEKWSFADNRVVGFACFTLFIDFFVENVMKEDFEAVGEVG